VRRGQCSRIRYYRNLCRSPIADRALSHCVALKTLCFTSLLACNRRLPTLFRHPPVDTVDQHRELCPCQHQRLARLNVRRPQEYAILEPLGEQAQSRAVPKDDLDEVWLSATDHEQVAAEGIKAQYTLHPEGAASRPISHDCWVMRAVLDIVEDDRDEHRLRRLRQFPLPAEQYPHRDPVTPCHLGYAGP
jgi:hypothetical protein